MTLLSRNDGKLGAENSKDPVSVKVMGKKKIHCKYLFVYFSCSFIILIFVVVMEDSKSVVYYRFLHFI